LARIFISYRRDDTEAEAGRIRDHLSRGVLCRHTVVRDLDSVRPGQQFETWIDRELERCRCVLFVIGPRWLSSLQERRRDEKVGKAPDRLRREIVRTLALCREDPRKLVVPVLVQGAEQPLEEQLAAIEPLLVPLALLQHKRLHRESFERDLKDLAADIPCAPSPWLAVTLLAALGGGGAMGWRAFHVGGHVAVAAVTTFDAAVAGTQKAVETAPARDAGGDLGHAAGPHHRDVHPSRGDAAAGRGSVQGTGGSATGGAVTTEAPRSNPPWEPYLHSVSCRPKPIIDEDRLWIRCECPPGYRGSRPLEIGGANQPPSDAYRLVKQIDPSWSCP
jgi:hypothetical protein